MSCIGIFCCRLKVTDVRRTVGDGVRTYTDYTQGLTVTSPMVGMNGNRLSGGSYGMVSGTDRTDGRTGRQDRGDVDRGVELSQRAAAPVPRRVFNGDYSQLPLQAEEIDL